MDKRTQNVGRAPQAYSKSWDHFREQVGMLIAYYHQRKIGGQWHASPNEVFRTKLEAGAKPNHARPLVLEMAFCDQETRRLRKEGVSFNAERYHHPELLSVPIGTELDLLIPLQRDKAPIVMLPGRQPLQLQLDYAYAANDTAGALESSRRKGTYLRGIAALDSEVPTIHPVDVKRRTTAAIPPPITAPTRGRASSIMARRRASWRPLARSSSCVPPPTRTAQRANARASIASLRTFSGSKPVAASEPIPTRILNDMVARMQRTHDRRRASFFVGPPGIGKSTAVQAFKAANPRNVMVTRIVKRGATGPQVLQSMLLALRERVGRETRYVTNATSEVQRYIGLELQKAADGLRRDDDPDKFPKLTIVFDEAQRLTNGAIDALRDWNEPHHFCAGCFPIGLIFVGNNELSLDAGKSGTSIIDEGMEDRLMYRVRLTYDHVDRADLERFARAEGIADDGAVAAIGRAFAAPNAQRSFRRPADFIDELRDEAGGGLITRETVRTVLELA